MTTVTPARGSRLAPRRNRVVLGPVVPSPGFAAEYRRRLDSLVDEMHRSLDHWVVAAYRNNAPELAQDASPTAELAAVLAKLTRRWTTRFDRTSKELALYFGLGVKDRTDEQLRAVLRRGGFAIKFTMTRAMNDAFQATVQENVGLIKSIASRHLSDVQGLVMRSVSRGGSLKELSEQIESRYQKTKNRAALIARDQNNKATSVMTVARYREMGVKKAVWRHSHGGHDKRPTHVANDGEEFDVVEGWLDPAVNERIWPGQLINCKCVSQAVFE